MYQGHDCFPERKKHEYDGLLTGSGRRWRTGISSLSFYFLANVRYPLFTITTIVDTLLKLGLPVLSLFFIYVNMYEGSLNFS